MQSKKSKYTIILDNGHGCNTPGKCSPDGKFREYLWAREMVMAISLRLKADGYNVETLVPEDEDVSLTQRCRRANAICKAHGALNCLLVSVHCNAAGSDGKWHEAHGWSVFVSNNCSINSCDLAGFMCDEAEKYFHVRKPLPYQRYWRQNLAMCRDTCCPAVLTENLFQDNKGDVELLNSPDGFNNLVNVHVKGIINYLDQL